jgi:hypothetical protein
MREFGGALDIIGKALIESGFNEDDLKSFRPKIARDIQF